MRILLCDYPSLYRFPSNGYGSIERWLATVAKYLVKLGHEVIISGPLWDVDYVPGVSWWRERLYIDNYKDFLKSFSRVDILIAGHEAFDEPKWERAYLAVADRCVSYQHGHELYRNQAYDGERKRLFCFSDEMMERFQTQNARKLICYSEGIDETPIKADSLGYLAWMGRIDEEKAVHYAIEAARLLGRKIVVMGEPVRSREYFESIYDLLHQPHVQWVGTQTASGKINYLSHAACFVYTCSPTWIEAAAAVLWEPQLCGVPLAGMSWRGGEAVVEAIGDMQRGGAIAQVNIKSDDDENVERLCDAIERSMLLDRDDVWKYGHERFNPITHVSGLIAD